MVRDITTISQSEHSVNCESLEVESPEKSQLGEERGRGRGAIGGRSTENSAWTLGWGLAVDTDGGADE